MIYGLTIQMTLRDFIEIHINHFEISASSLLPLVLKLAAGVKLDDWVVERSLHVATRPIALLTHWGRATHICVGKLTIIGPDNGLSPGRRQAIIWTIAGILSTWPLGTNFSDILIGIQTFSFKKMHLKISSAKWRPFVSVSMS